jgi:hypothetical protein
VDASGGVAFRARDAQNYYVVRANALEDNVRLYTVIDGRRKQNGDSGEAVAASSPAAAPAAEAVVLPESDNPAAILARQGSRESLRLLAQGLGFEPAVMDQSAQLVELLRYETIPLVVLSLGADFADDAAYRLIARMLMDRRRKMYVALLAPGLETANYLLAWSLSVNMVIAANDSGQAGELLKNGLREWRNFVTRYHKCLTEAGRF